MNLAWVCLTFLIYSPSTRAPDELKPELKDHQY